MLGALMIMLVCAIPAIVLNIAIAIMKHMGLTLGEGIFLWIACGVLARLIYLALSEESIDVGRLSIIGPFSLLWAVGTLICRGIKCVVAK